MRLRSAVLAMVVVWLSLAAAAPIARGDQSMDATVWVEAEAAVRAHLTKLRVTAKEITRLPGHSFADFQITLEDGTRTGAVVVGGVVYLRGKPSNRTITAILRGAEVLRTHALTADDLIYLLASYGTFTASQRDLQRAITTLAWPGGHAPKLAWGARSATLTLHWAPASRRHGSSPWIVLNKATLKISSSYALSWRRGTVKVDAGADLVGP